MTQTAYFHGSVVISNHYHFELFSPIREVILRYGNADGKVWGKELDIERLASKPSLREELELGDEIAEIIYPITCDFDMWLTDKNGIPIESIRAEDPGMPIENVSSQKITYPDGREMIFNQPRSFTHIIQVGWMNGSARTFEIRADMWPPTIFMQGNNKLRAMRIHDLSQHALRTITEKLDLFADEVQEYELAHCFIVPSDKPYGVRFPLPS